MVFQLNQTALRWNLARACIGYLVDFVLIVQIVEKKFVVNWKKTWKTWHREARGRSPCVYLCLSPRPLALKAIHSNVEKTRAATPSSLDGPRKDIAKECFEWLTMIIFVIITAIIVVLTVFFVWKPDTDMTLYKHVAFQAVYARYNVGLVRE